MSYTLGLWICGVLSVVGVIVGTMALMNSVKEVQLLRESGQHEIEEPVIGSPGSSVLGALVAGIVSATLVGLYGAGPEYLYLGPIAAMVAAAGVIVCFIQDIKDKKEVEQVLKE